MSEKRSFSTFQDWYEHNADQINLDGPVDPPAATVDRKRLSQKSEDIFAREVIATDPELSQAIQEVMTKLMEADLSLPFLHITPHKLVDASGTIVDSTDNVASITADGLQKMHTNVGGFISSANESINNPAHFVDNPELFVKDTVKMLKHYAHHGTRLNHSSHNTYHPDAVRGIPAVVLIDGSLSVMRGTDYEDHFKLVEGATSQDIIGVIDTVPKTSRPEEVAKFVEQLMMILAEEVELTAHLARISSFSAKRKSLYHPKGQ